MISSTPGTRPIAQTAVDLAADQSDPGPSPRCERTGLGFRAAFLGAACIGLLALAACDEHKQAAAPPPKPAVGVRPAAMKGVSQSFEFVGRIKAIEKVEVRARVEGFLEKVLFREGQDVKAGDLLYQIEKVQFQAQVDQAKANLASAEAEATNAQLAVRPQPSTSSKQQFSPQCEGRPGQGRARQRQRPRSCRCRPR